VKAFFAAAALYFVAFGVPDLPAWVSLPSVVSPVSQADAVAYVYEKDDGPIPGGVMVAMARLNSERQIMATFYEEDATGVVPEQYKLPLEAAKKVGLPALVVSGNGVVLKVVPKPGTEAAVMESIP